MLLTRLHSLLTRSLITVEGTTLKRPADMLGVSRPVKTGISLSAVSDSIRNVEKHSARKTLLFSNCQYIILKANKYYSSNSLCWWSSGNIRFWKWTPKSSTSIREDSQNVKPKNLYKKDKQTWSLKGKKKNKNSDNYRDSGTGLIF